MEILMQHFQATWISKGVSRLTAAPMRPLTIYMNDDRWFHFAGWAAEQRINPFGPTGVQVASFLLFLLRTHSLTPRTFNGYLSCLDRITPHLISFMKLETQGPLLIFWVGPLGYSLLHGKRRVWPQVVGQSVLEQVAPRPQGWHKTSGLAQHDKINPKCHMSYSIIFY